MAWCSHMAAAKTHVREEKSVPGTIHRITAHNSGRLAELRIQRMQRFTLWTDRPEKCFGRAGIRLRRGITSAAFPKRMAASTFPRSMGTSTASVSRGRGGNGSRDFEAALLQRSEKGWWDEKGNRKNLGGIICVRAVLDSYESRTAAQPRSRWPGLVHQ